MSNAGCSLPLSDCTHRLSINFLEPTLLISLHSLKTISLATSAWTNSSRYFHPIPLIRALKSRLLRSHVNPLHVVPLPLPLPLTPNHLPPVLTLQLSRPLLPILPILPLPTLSLLPFPLFLVLKSQYQTPLLAVAPRGGIRTLSFQNSYLNVIPLGYNKLALHRSALQALLPYVPLLQGPHLTQPLTHSSRWIFETTILPTQTLPKAKVKARVNHLTKVKARAKKDKAKDAANLKAKKNGPPPLHLPSLPHQPKGKARNNFTPHSSLSHCPFHGPACHCGRPRPTSLSPSLSTRGVASSFSQGSRKFQLCHPLRLKLSPLLKLPRKWFQLECCCKLLFRESPVIL